ncbi:AAA domain-containing protein [Hypoxylon sp. NC1633]|nr:AAA domain-containing protein [Hypoxylon sp. NC1633]
MAIPNIYIIGSQCTGKTTLTNVLIDRFNHTRSPPERPAVIKEVARTILKTHGFNADDIRNSKERAMELQRLIMEAQFENEQSLAKGGCWYVSDRSALDTIVYGRIYAGRDAAHALLESSKWAEMRDRMADSLVVVCEAGADWLIDDGVRLMPTSREEWLEVHSEFCRALEDFGLTYEVLSCKVEAMEHRLDFVLSKWEELKKRRISNAA